jgi:hypothetical protein
MLHMFHTFVAKCFHLDGCICLLWLFKCFHVFCKCFRCTLQVFHLFERMLQVFRLDVAKVDWMLHMLQCAWEADGARVVPACGLVVQATFGWRGPHVDGRGVWRECEHGVQAYVGGRAGANADMDCRCMRGKALALPKKKRKEKKISGKFIGPDTPRRGRPAGTSQEWIFNNK